MRCDLSRPVCFYPCRRVARVLRCLGGLYTLCPEIEGDAVESRETAPQENLNSTIPVALQTEEGYLLAKPRGIFRKHKLKVLPGDLVAYDESGDVDIPWSIVEVKPRQTLLVRPPMANLTKLLLCFSMEEPLCDFLLLDRLILLARTAGVEVELIWTKADLIDEERLAYFEERIAAYKRAGFHSVMTGESGPYLEAREAYIQASQARIQGGVWALSGPSGVGKSTLFNAFMGCQQMETAALMSKSARGRQTTRHVELLPYHGGYLADSPGFTAMDVQHRDLAKQKWNLGLAYPEFQAQSEACRFAECKHRSEPDCAVKAAIEAEPSLKGRYQRYLALLEELEQLAQNRYR